MLIFNRFFCAAFSFLCFANVALADGISLSGVPGTFGDGINGAGGFRVLAADGILASVDLSCQTNQASVNGVTGLVSRFVTVSRTTTPTANQSTVSDSNGNYSLVADNTLRVSNQGCLVEEQRTNSISNNSMQGAIVIDLQPEMTTNGNLALNPISPTQSTLLNGWQWSPGLGTPGTVVWNGVDGVMLTGNTVNFVSFGTGGLPTVVGNVYTVSFDSFVGSLNVFVGTSAFGANVFNSGAVAPGAGKKVQFVATSTTTFISFSTRGTSQVKNISIISAGLAQNGSFALNPINASQSTVLNGWQWKNNAGTGTVVWNGSNLVTVTPDNAVATVFGSAALTTAVGATYTLTADVLVNAASVQVSTATLGGGTLLLNVTSGTGAGQQFQFTATTTTTFVSFAKTTTGAFTVDNVSVTAVGKPPNLWTVAGPGGIITSATVVGLGTENGIDYIDYQWVINGAGSVDLISSFDAGAAAANAQVWTASMFVELIGSSSTPNITHSLSIFEQGGTPASSTQNFVPTNAALGSQRVVLSYLNAQAGTTNEISRYSITATGPQTYTLRIGWPQLERNVNATTAAMALVSSPIRTTAGAVARGGDVVKMAGLTFGAAYTLYAQGLPNAPVADAVSQILAQIDDGTNTNRFILYRNLTNANPQMAMLGPTGAFGAQTLAAVPWLNATGRLALGITGGAQSGVYNASGINAQTSPTLASLNTLALGADEAPSTFFNGYIQRTALWLNNKISDAGLATLTTTPGVLNADTPAVQATIDLNCRTNVGFNQGLSGPVSQFVTASHATTPTANQSTIVDSNGNYSLVNDNVLRQSNLGCLVEEMRTNGLSWSAAPTLTNGWSFTNSSTSLQAGAGPGSGLDAYLYDDGDSVPGTVAHNMSKAFVVSASGQAWTYSVVIKYVNAQWVQLVFPAIEFGNFGFANFDLQNCVAGTGTVGANAVVAATKNANGWCVIQISSLTTSSGTNNASIGVIPASNSTRSITYIANHGQFLVWNQQVERNPTATTAAQGAASSPIITSGSTVTRNGDVITLNSVPAFGSTTTAYLQGIPATPVAYPTIQIGLGWNDGTVTNKNSLGRENATGNARFEYFNAGNNFATDGASWLQAARSQLAAAIAASTQGVGFNGVLTSASNVSGYPGGTLTVVDIGNNENGSQFEGFIERVAVWPANRISNTGLQTLTATPH